MNTPIKLLVGLGNPGEQYRHTRHNAGWDFVELIADQYQCTLKPEAKFHGLTGRIMVGGKELRLLIPTTFMNRSGQAIAAAANFYKIPPEAILVAHDELDMAPGVARLKIGGGHGGHNGLRDTISALANSKDFARLRLGIGHPGDAKKVSGYVLKRAPESEFKLTADAIYEASRVVPLLVTGEWPKAMQQLHTTS
ncbi:aminoacyl-tRNA hydrolase [Halioxenophilus sp. WMMB6]|uniref:aminoacyl-tRNA hydrolase n=1 Tax=Halioxenophilus sp. WMMB6 TaxID=3073815 RepID=UPI00295F4162|nr:aminoacyl-tRNA hydrolase [Halioxenophilus sp. WMMB6]